MWPRNPTYYFDPSRIILSQIRYCQLESKFDERLHAFKKAAPSKIENEASWCQRSCTLCTMFRNLGILIAASVIFLGIFNVEVEAVEWKSSKSKAHQLHSRAVKHQKSQRNFNQTDGCDDCDDYRFQTKKTTRKNRT